MSSTKDNFQTQVSTPNDDEISNYNEETQIFHPPEIELPTNISDVKLMIILKNVILQAALMNNSMWKKWILISALQIMETNTVPDLPDEDFLFYLHNFSVIKNYLRAEDETFKGNCNANSKAAENKTFKGNCNANSKAAENKTYNGNCNVNAKAADNFNNEKNSIKTQNNLVTIKKEPNDLFNQSEKNVNNLIKLEKFDSIEDDEEFPATFINEAEFVGKNNHSTEYDDTLLSGENNYLNISMDISCINEPEFVEKNSHPTECNDTLLCGENNYLHTSMDISAYSERTLNNGISYINPCYNRIKENCISTPKSAYSKSDFETISNHSLNDTTNYFVDNADKISVKMCDKSTQTNLNDFTNNLKPEVEVSSSDNVLLGEACNKSCSIEWNLIRWSDSPKERYGRKIEPIVVNTSIPRVKEKFPMFYNLPLIKRHPVKEPAIIPLEKVDSSLFPLGFTDPRVSSSNSFRKFDFNF